MRFGIVLFVIAALVGVLGSNAIYTHFQGAESEASVLQNRAKIELTDADKKLIEARDSTSKWLLGLAFGLLPGLVVSRSADGESEVQEKLLPLLAGAMLITSVYGFFLAQDSVVFVLSRGPQYHLYGWLSNFPILVQFWPLLAALVLLMIHWLRPAGKLTFPTLALGLALIFPAPDASAAAVRAETALPCVRSWSTDRQMRLSAEQLARASGVMVGVANRSDVVPQNACEFVSAQLDQVRWFAFQQTKSDQPPAFDALLKVMESDLKNTGLSPGEALERLLGFGAIWRSQSGLMRIEGKPAGATVFIDSRPVGLTNLDIRIRPGKYLVEVVVDGAPVLRKVDVLIEDGKLWKTTF